jgi:DeoR family fructose operon transcriptional repressor
MFAIERVKIIKNHLIEDKKVSVTKLSELLDVTEVTIRRDLVKLEREGFLQRIHGGAVILDYIEEEKVDPPEDYKTIEQCKEIATTAFHLVTDFDTIMLTEGFVNLQIAKKLATKNNLTVITNELRIAEVFSNSPTNNLIVLGGDLDGFGLYGQMSIDNLEHFTFNHLFIEADGIDIHVGVTVSSTKKATLIQKALPVSKTISMVCLSKYFGKKALYRVCQVRDSKNILTDSSLNNIYKDYLFDHNLKVFTSVNAYER